MESEFEGDTHELTEQLLPAVRQVMSVEGTVAGGPKQGFAARFMGRLIIDSQEAYARLEPIFADKEMTVLFREMNDQHAILAMPGLIRPTPSNPWKNLLMFLLTVLSVLFTGVLNAAGYLSSTWEDFQGPVINLSRDLPLGILFTVSILAILLAHEFGHYLAARYHKTAVSLPYFLPFPGSQFGTMGAFIQLKEPPRNRRVLLDIGIAGPLAGLIVAIPVLLIGLSLSEIDTLPMQPNGDAIGGLLEGNSILYLGAKYIVKGELLPAPSEYDGISPVAYWLRYIFVGLPIPYGGRDVLLHPVAWAGWAGLLVTALNLIPAGQLDGGHAIYVLLGRRAARLWPFIVVALALMGVIWFGWFIWAALIFFLGRTYAQPLDDITPLDMRRRALAMIGLIVFVLVFTPVPLRGF